uniref:Response regulatory domain-containing protein n=1 Tax=Chromera velia CCMP2878 TaxID=1169474 RepID=A0A0G4FVT2_9ALVE|eukprot:Cvel_3797.t1-p1 / transcript=Cvel_3797.t1 / gene=Cvel_3797 / organism=Chromera_velia_CCMP2878 / gene_product=hypothetical protein / transcript_product=hypothetical protein / location=Cvel_scaffold159:105082-105864(-) / protein_length=261 / sequence_SO=supercontig / SO=protein_coding / is_pseudo=false
MLILSEESRTERKPIEPSSLFPSFPPQASSSSAIPSPLGDGPDLREIAGSSCSLPTLAEKDDSEEQVEEETQPQEEGRSHETGDHEEKEGNKAQSPKSANDTDASLETADVLLVDDDRFCLLAGSVAIRHLGFSVKTAEDGEDACEMIINQGESFRVILMDKNMARMEGPEAVEKLVAHFNKSQAQTEKQKDTAAQTPNLDQPNGKRKRIHPRLLIVGCTGDATPEVQSIFLRAGADRVVFKPFKPLELADTLSGHLKAKE